MAQFWCFLGLCGGCLCGWLFDCSDCWCLRGCGIVVDVDVFVYVVFVDLADCSGVSCLLVGCCLQMCVWLVVLILRVWLIW